jgi:hypothetical protein
MHISSWSKVIHIYRDDDNILSYLALEVDLQRNYDKKAETFCGQKRLIRWDYPANTEEDFIWKDSCCKVCRKAYLSKKKKEQKKEAAQLFSLSL